MKKIPSELSEKFGTVSGRRVLVQDYPGVWNGINEEGEAVMLEISSSGIKLTTSQQNGWVRVNYFDAEGYPSGETFDRKWHSAACSDVEDIPRKQVEAMMEKLGLTPACREGICPLCGEHINYGSFELVDEGGLFAWECPGCGATGKEGYDLVFDGSHYDVRRADGTPVDPGALTGIGRS